MSIWGFPQIAVQTARRETRTLRNKDQNTMAKDNAHIPAGATLDDEIRVVLTTPVTAERASQVRARAVSHQASIQAAARAAHARSLDVRLSLADVDAARTDAAELAFQDQRLTSGLEALEERIAELQGQEQATADAEFYAEALKERDEIVNDLRHSVGPKMRAIAEVLARLRTNEDKIAKANQRRGGCEVLVSAEAIVRDCPRDFQWPSGKGAGPVRRLTEWKIPALDHAGDIFPPGGWKP